jgi:hydrogenase-4 component B
VSDPILLFLAVDAIALLLLGLCAAALPVVVCGFVATTASGLGMLLCLPSLLMRSPATSLGIPVGPPGLPLHLALDPLSASFLFIVFLAGTAISAYQATAVPVPPAASVRMTACGLAGTILLLLAADGVSMALGLAVTCCAVSLPTGTLSRSARTDVRRHAMLLVPLLVLAAVCLLTPSGFAPRFDAIRAAPVYPGEVVPVALLTVAAVVGLAYAGAAEPCWTRDALTACLLIPAGSYLLLRLIADLSDGTSQTVCGFVLLLVGGAIAVTQAWSAATQSDIDRSVACLMRRQAGLAMASLGLALIARGADLPGAASLALAAVFLSAVGCGVAGVSTSLAAHAIGASAGTYRLSRLGGLVHTMPGTSAALAAGLLSLSALPPGLGFAVMWLLFEAILSAPRTGGLMFQLPLALIVGALALSAALATAASVRVIGVAVLGRPRTPRGSGALEIGSPSRALLLALAALGVLAGVLPGSVLRLLAAPVIGVLVGSAPGAHMGLTMLSASTVSAGYRALPVSALLALATAASMLLPRRPHKESKVSGPWAGGLPPSAGLPFGEPAAQSVGQGFVPALPNFQLPRLPRIGTPRPARPPSVTAGLWLVLAVFGVLLLFLTVLE